MLRVKPVGAVTETLPAEGSKSNADTVSFFTVATPTYRSPQASASGLAMRDVAVTILASRIFCSFKPSIADLAISVANNA